MHASPCSSPAARGSEKLSVPDGTYSFEFTVLTPDSRPGYDTALVVKPQFTVASNLTVTLDARAAIPYHVTLTGTPTPRRGPRSSDSPGPAVRWRNRRARPGVRAEHGPDLQTGRRADRCRHQAAGDADADGHQGKLGFDAYAMFTTLVDQSNRPDPSYTLDFPHVGRIPASLNVHASPRRT